MIQLIKPNSEILKKHIEGFYLFNGKTTDSLKYLAFPHFNTGLSIFKGVTINRQQWNIKICESNKKNINIEVLGKYTCPLLIEYLGKVEEISIIFKPLGVNRFFQAYFDQIAPEYSQELNNPLWTEFGVNYFKNNWNLNQLESYLLSQLNDNQILDNLELSLQYLNGIKEEIPIADIAKLIGYNPKTFQRLFKKHVGCTPIEYKRICKFRNSIIAKFDSIEIKTLTDLSYENGFFDQSHFIKEFKKLTHHNPKDFFKSAKKVDGEKIVWQIL